MKEKIEKQIVNWKENRFMDCKYHLSSTCLEESKQSTIFISEQACTLNNKISELRNTNN